MSNISKETIDRIRDASRRMVRELGFMRPTLAGTEYHASAVHALIEVGTRGPLSPATLADLLGLEKSSVSRLLRKLVIGGELQEIASEHDGRSKLLRLTAKGQRTLANIHAFARKQVVTALNRLEPDQRKTVAEGLAHYADALSRGTPEPQVLPASEVALPIVIEQGYRPGVIGRVTELHADYYSRHACFGEYFERQVATGMADVVSRLGSPANGLWVALRGDRIVGSIAIDGEDLGGNVAHLRFFIVDESVQGGGVGGRLLAEALRFCDVRRFAATHLWTFRGLDAARRLYERAGFHLQKEREGAQWGSTVVEQMFVRTSSTDSQA